MLNFVKPLSLLCLPTGGETWKTFKRIKRQTLEKQFERPALTAASLILTSAEKRFNDDLRIQSSLLCSLHYVYPEGSADRVRLSNRPTGSEPGTSTIKVNQLVAWSNPVDRVLTGAVRYIIPDSWMLPS